MTPAEIGALYGLDDKGMINLLRVAPSTWDRWASGAHKPVGLAVVVLQALEVASKYLSPAERERAGGELRLGLGAFILHGLKEISLHG